MKNNMSKSFGNKLSIFACAVLALMAIPAFADSDTTTATLDQEDTAALETATSDARVTATFVNNSDQEIRTFMYLGCASGPDYSDVVIPAKKTSQFSWTANNGGSCGFENKVVRIGVSGGPLNGTVIGWSAGWSMPGSSHPFGKASTSLKSDSLSVKVQKNDPGTAVFVIDNK
jgi:hypothetical protein